MSTEQNGSGTSAVRKQWFDDHGNLAWSMDELGRVTYYGYDSLTGRLAQTIQDIDEATADELELDIPDGWTLPASGGANLSTEYQHDAFGRITQTLGPAHTADINGTPTSVRTATWTFYNDATHETRSAQGYVVVSTSATVILGPISITKTDRDGRVTDRIQAAYTGDVEDLSTATISQSDYTAWTTYQYQKTRLVSSRFYHDIPTSGTGTSGVNYLQTTYGYETFGTGKMGRQNRTVAPDGTITRVVYDARGNVLETWIGTNDTGATDTDPTGGSAQGNDMALFSSSEFDADGNIVSSTDALSRTTEYAYDWRGRMVEKTAPDPDGEGDLTSSVTEYVYDNLNRMIQETDPLGNLTTYGYDVLGRLYRLTQPDPDGEGGLQSPVTNYFYDAAGNLTSLIDPVGNTTSWVYDGLGRMIEETNELDHTRYFEYNEAGNLIQKTDRNGRVTQYVYDGIGRLLEENWLDGQQSVIWTIAYVYDSAGRLESVGDEAAEYVFAYDDAGRVLTETQTIAGLTPVVVFNFQYDANGRRTQVAATIGEDDDFVIDYSYDYLGRLTRIEQYGVQGGNAVSEKRVDFTYDAASQYDTITRYADLAATDLVATATYGYDLAGRLTSLTYTKGQTTLVDYAWSFDAANRMTQYVNSIDGTVDYTSDNTGQLTGADYDYQDDESYAYDENGNRVTANGSTYATGDNNQLLSDGIYRYLYDAEGNRVARFIDADESGTLNTGDTDITSYTWDHRNRLTTLTHFDDYTDYTGEDPDQVVSYSYGYQNRLVRKVLDADGDGDTDSSTVFIHDGSGSSPLPQAGEGPRVMASQTVLQFDKSGTADAAASDVSHRYLWGQAVDQLLADEEVTDLETTGDVSWLLVDHLNTVRDLATYDSQNDETTIANHRVFDAYGRLTSETNAAVDCLFAFTGRAFDEHTGLQNNLNRWYDPAVGRWLSEDPITFDAGDMSLYRYCANNPLIRVDPLGTNWFTDMWDWLKEWFDTAKTSICPAAEPLGVLECAPGMAHAMILSTARNSAVNAEILYGPDSPQAKAAWKAYNDAAAKLQDNVQECLGGKCPCPKK